MASTVRATVNVSGACPSCGTTNNVSKPHDAVPGSSVLLTHDIACGKRGCGNRFTIRGLVSSWPSK